MPEERIDMGLDYEDARVLEETIEILRAKLEAEREKVAELKKEVRSRASKKKRTLRKIFSLTKKVIEALNELDEKKK